MSLAYRLSAFPGAVFCSCSWSCIPNPVSPWLASLLYSVPRKPCDFLLPTEQSLLSSLSPGVPLQPEGDMPCTFPWPRTHFPSILQLMLHFMAEFKCLLLQEVLQDFYTVVHTREKGQNKATLTSCTRKSRGEHQNGRSGGSEKSSVQF